MKGLINDKPKKNRCIFTASCNNKTVVAYANHILTLNLTLLVRSSSAVLQTLQTCSTLMIDSMFVLWAPRIVKVTVRNRSASP